MSAEFIVIDHKHTKDGVYVGPSLMSWYGGIILRDNLGIVLFNEPLIPEYIQAFKGTGIKSTGCICAFYIEADLGIESHETIEVHGFLKTWKDIKSDELIAHSGVWCEGNILVNKNIISGDDGLIVKGNIRAITGCIKSTGDISSGGDIESGDEIIALQSLSAKRGTIKAKLGVTSGLTIEAQTIDVGTTISAGIFPRNNIINYEDMMIMCHVLKSGFVSSGMTCQLKDNVAPSEDSNSEYVDEEQITLEEHGVFWGRSNNLQNFLDEHSPEKQLSKMQN